MSTISAIHVELGRPVDPAGTRRNLTVDRVCRVLESGTLHVGDTVVLEPVPTTPTQQEAPR